MTAGYDLERLTPSGPVTEHHDGAFETDGPWLILRGPTPDAPEAIIPAHAVVCLRRCEGGCQNGRE